MTGALARQLQTALARAPSTIAGGEEPLLCPDNLQSTAQTIAQALMAFNITPSEPVLCHIANRPRDLAALLGIWLAGGVAVPAHAAAAEASVLGIRRATGARLRVSGAHVDEVSKAAAPAHALLHDAALIVFTSGSTGKPKGVVLGHERLAGKLQVLDRLLKLAADDVVVVPLRLTFIFGIWVSLLTILSGAHLVLVPKFTAAGLASKLTEGASVVAVVPTMLRALLAHARAPTAPRLRTLLSGGETLGSRLGLATRAAFPHTQIHDLYGLTETGSCDFCLPPTEFAAGLGSIGRPTSQVEYRIVDANGRPVTSGTAGELCIKTPFGMLGYLDGPNLATGSDPDGYLRTGDQARLRPDGRVEIVGRLKDIIARGGNKIAAAEIDALLARHPQVTGALCAGVPDVRLGEAIHAIVALVPGSRLTPQELRRWAAGQTEKFKVPDVIYIRDALPTGRTGKLNRAAVARLARAARKSGRP